MTDKKLDEAIEAWSNIKTKDYMPTSINTGILKMFVKHAKLYSYILPMLREVIEKRPTATQDELIHMLDYLIATMIGDE